MKIGVIHLGFFYAGGGEKLVLEQVRGLRALGHEVECFAPVVDPPDCFPELIAEVGVRRLLPPPPRWLPGRVAAWVLLACALAPLLALRLRRFDVLLAANQPAPWLAWVASRMFGKPYVAYLAQPNRVLYPRPIDLEVNRPNLDYRLAALLSRLARPIVAWADRVSVAGAAAVLGNGSYMTGVLERIYERSMISCPAGGYPPAVAPGSEHRRSGSVTLGNLSIRKPFVLLTNRHYPQKRFDYAIQAMAEVPGGAVLVVTGARTAYTATLDERARQLGMTERVVYTGLICEADLTRLYGEAAVYVYPAPEEDYGMGIVEAMAHGVPAVAWRSAGPTSSMIDNETGFLIEPFDVEAFSGAIARLLNDESLAGRMGEAAWRRVMSELSYARHCRVVELELAHTLRHRRSAGRRLGWVRLALQAAIGLGLIAIWAHVVPLSEALAHARPQRLGPLLAIIPLAVLSSLLRARRWALLLGTIRHIRTMDAFWANAAGGLLNYIAPVRAGDAARLVVMSHRHHVPGAAALATIVLDKTLDLAAIAAVLLAASLAALAVAGPRHAGTVALFGAALAATALLATGVLTVIAGHRVARLPLIPGRWRAALARQAEAFAFGARGSLSATRLLPAAALSGAALLIDGLAFSLLFVALGIPVAPVAATIGYAALLLTYVLPAAPGYVGNLEVLGSLVLGAGLGLPAITAGGAIVLWHLLISLLVIGLGLPALVRLRKPARAAGRVRRIAVFHCGFTYSGGGERIVLEEVMGLRRLGYAVECYAPTVDRRSCYPDLIGQVAPRSFLPQLPRFVPLREALQMIASSSLVALYAWRFAGVDLIVGANQPGVYIAWVVARLLGKPYVAYLNQPNRLVYPRSIDLQTGWQVRPDYQVLNAAIRRIRWFVAWVDRRSIRQARTLLVNGAYIGAVIGSTYDRDTVDCPAGCHVVDGEPLASGERFAGSVQINGTTIPKPYVLLTNRHYPQKRFDLAIEAMSIVRRRHPQVRLVIPGDATPHTEVLRALTRKLGLEDTVLFLGVITEAQLQRLYAEAAVYVYPAPEEDFGMGIIEAMSFGVPVVAWNQAGPTVTVRDRETGYLARVGDVADYALGIERFLADAEYNEETGRKARRRAALFSWTRHVATLQSAIEAALGQVEAPERAEPTEPALEAAA